MLQIQKHSNIQKDEKRREKRRQDEYMYANI